MRFRVRLLQDGAEWYGVVSPADSGAQGSFTALFSDRAEVRTETSRSRADAVSDLEMVFARMGLVVDVDEITDDAVIQAH